MAKVGDAVIGYVLEPARRQSTWTRHDRRLHEIERLIVHRHGRKGVDTDDGELYFRAAMPHLVALAEAPGATRRPVHRLNNIAWAARFCPRLLDEHDPEWFAAVDREYCRRPRAKWLRSDALAKELGVRNEERVRLKLSEIGAVDMDRRARRKERKKRDAEYQAERRAASGAKPRSASLTATKPWIADGVSRRTWEKRRAAERARDANSSATFEASKQARDANSSARTIYRTTATNLRQRQKEASAAAAIEAAPSRSVGAGGHSPRAKTPPAAIIRSVVLRHSVGRGAPASSVSVQEAARDARADLACQGDIFGL